MSAPISLVVFLGNPGPLYAGNRHNAGWQLSDALFWVKGASWADKFRGSLARFSGSFEGSGGAGSGVDHPVYFLKPLTFMNLSGESAAEAARFYKIPPAEVLVVHDELELAFGLVSLKWGGGLGGHNGLRSMETNLGTRDFWRLRIGVGRPKHPDVAGYVLSNFTADERAVLPVIFALAGNLLRDTLLRGAEVVKLGAT